MMKSVTLLILSFLFFPVFAQTVNESDCYYKIHYQSNNYDIYINYCCEEGEIACDKIYYRGVNRQNGSEISLKGKTRNNALSQRFIGYQFENGNYTYFVDEQFLRIYQNDELIMEEEITEVE